MKLWLQTLGRVISSHFPGDGTVQTPPAEEGVKRFYDAWIEVMDQAEKRCDAKASLARPGQTRGGERHGPWRVAAVSPVW